MGSNTSTNTDTNNIYTEQQYVETVEDKYAELLRQNELLRQENKKAKEDNQKFKEENELLKSGNYNLQRDNDRLRGDIYNLRLENSKMTEDNRNCTINRMREIQRLEKDKQEQLQKEKKNDFMVEVRRKLGEVNESMNNIHITLPESLDTNRTHENVVIDIIGQKRD